MKAAEFFQSIIDPRGRISRKGFLIVSLVIMALEVLGSLLIFKVGLAPDGYMVAGLKISVLWLCLTAFTKRMHDLGYSAWWLAAAIAAQAAWTAIFVSVFIAMAGFDRLLPGSLWSYGLYAGAMMPALGFLFWLQLAQGEARTNVFGYEPNDLGFGQPAVAIRQALPLSQPASQ